MMEAIENNVGKLTYFSHLIDSSHRWKNFRDSTGPSVKPQELLQAWIETLPENDQEKFREKLTGGFKSEVQHLPG